MIAGRGDLTMPGAVGLKPLNEESIIVTDGRDLDPAEKEMLVQSEVVHLPEAELLLDHPLPDGPLYIHFDVDVVSLDESPAQNYPAEGGPSAALLHAVFGRLAATGRVGAVSVAAWNPALDPIGKSQAVSMALLHTLVGSLNT